MVSGTSNEGNSSCARNQQQHTAVILIFQFMMMQIYLILERSILRPLYVKSNLGELSLVIVVLSSISGNVL